MEVLFRGVPPQERQYRGTCLNCQSVVQFKQSEGTYRRCEYNDYCYDVTCPVCKKTISVDSGNYLK